MKRFYKKVIKGDTDGCTGVPDFNFGKCCDMHDVYYGIGGGEKERIIADRILRYCIRAHGHKKLAWGYWVGVRFFGVFHFDYRWRKWIRAKMKNRKKKND